MRYDIFCRVIDNFGDAAICWRLARQLALEHGGLVRLWLDRPEVLAALRPDWNHGTPHARLEGVEVVQWSPDMKTGDPGEIVVEGFGCGLPEPFVQEMVRRSPQSLWIVLDYLSAETWVGEYHGLRSPHPTLELQRFFFFPGFTPATGGLLREADLKARRSAFLADPDARASFWRDLGFPPPAGDTQTVSLFGYDNSNLDMLLRACAEGAKNIVIAVPPSHLRRQACHFFGENRCVDDGAIFRRGRLELRLIPFLGQMRYDELLWACDLNFVRGEDSFVRAQWAGVPFVWQIYPQADGAHLIKLEAFLNLYLKGLNPTVAAALRRFWSAWNTNGMLLPEYWQDLRCHAAELQGHAKQWNLQLAEMPDLATNLAIFCSERLKSAV